MEIKNENTEISATSKVIVSNNNDLKKIFNYISTSFFLLVLFLALLALFIPIYRIGNFAAEVSGERGSFFIFNYILSHENHRFRGGIYLVVMVAVIYCVIRGAIYGIKSFRDGNDKMATFVAWVLGFLLVPFLFTRMLQSSIVVPLLGNVNMLDISIFLPIVLIIGLISLITKVIFSVFLENEKLTKNQFTAIILSNLSTIVLVIGMVVFFSTSGFIATASGINIRLGAFALSTEIQDFQNTLGNSLEQLNNLVSSLGILVLIYIALAGAIAEILVRIFRKSVNTSAKNIKSINQYILAGFIIIAVLFVASIVLIDSIEGMVEITTGNSQIIGLFLAVLAAGGAVASTVISSKDNV